MAGHPGTAVFHRAAYLIGWSLLRQRQWIGARHAFAAIDTESPAHPSAQRLAAALDTPPELPQRSPTIARALSMLLPGAGQIYTGRPLDGIIGLGVHGALIAGTTGAVLAGLEGAAGVGAFFTWGFYRTQLSNAAISARDFNTQAEERFIDQLAAQEHTFLAADPLSIRCSPSSQARGR
jgi:TM2 domain-containing membrane protein YozV